MTARATAARLVTSVPLLWVSIAAVTFLAIGLMFRRSAPTPLIPPEVRQEIDSLKASGAKDRATLDSLKTSAVAAQERGQVGAGHAEVIVTRSRVDAHRSDSLAAEARRQALNADSALRVADLYRQAYDSRTLEADELQRAVDTLIVAHKADSTAIALFKGGLLISQQRVAGLEHLNAELQDVVKKAEQGCRFLFWRCPSRTTVFIVGGTVGAIGGAAAVVSLTR